MPGPNTLADSAFELLLPSGTALSNGTTLAADLWVPLNLAATFDQHGERVEPSLRDFLAASDNDLPVSKRLIVQTFEDWFGGAGVAYNVAPGVYTRGKGWATPAGASTDVTIPATDSISPIVAVEEFGGNIYVAQSGAGSANEARVLESSGGTGGLSNVLTLGAVESIHDLLIFDDGAGDNVLWASSNDSNGGRLHKWDGSVWTSTASNDFGANRRERLAKVFWVDDNGIGAWRMVAISGPKTISYTIPNADPMLAASWVEGVRIETGASFGLRNLVASRRHVWVVARDNLFDLDEHGNSPALLAESSALPFTGQAAEYLDNYVYMTYGSGLIRVYVGEQGLLQSRPGQCAPGWFTEAEHPYAGPVVAMTTDQGYLVAATYNVTTGYAGIWWGMDRKELGVETDNPLVWYGPEIHSTGDNLVTALKVSGLGPYGLNIWVASVSFASGASSPRLSVVSLPVAQTPINDLLSASSHKFATGSGSGRWNPTSYLESLPIIVDDTNSKKHLHRHSIATRGTLTSGTKIEYKTRADPAPNSTTYTTTDQINGTASPQEVTPATVVSGNRLQWLANFVSPSGGASTPLIRVLDAVRITLFRKVPSFQVKSIPVEYGDAIETPGGARGMGSIIHPDIITMYLRDAANIGRTIIRDNTGARWYVNVEQSLDAVETASEGQWKKRVSATMEISFIGLVSP